jgi:large subunit ribosomal protein L22
MTGPKTNERPGTRAQVRYLRVSPSKAREVLDLIRGLPVDRADEVLQFTERAVSHDVRKVLASAVANAAHNDQITDESVLYVSACFADEGPTLKRWRPRARGRATRIRKRTCHITIIVSVMPTTMLAKAEADRESTGGARGGIARRGRQNREARRARVARSRQAEGHEDHDHDHDEDHDHADEVDATENESPEEAEAVEELADDERGVEAAAGGEGAEGAAASTKAKGGA